MVYEIVTQKIRTFFGAHFRFPKFFDIINLHGFPMLFCDMISHVINVIAYSGAIDAVVNFEFFPMLVPHVFVKVLFDSKNSGTLQTLKTGFIC